MLGYIEIVPIFFFFLFNIFINAMNGLQSQNWWRQNSANFSKNEHVGYSFSKIFIKKSLNPSSVCGENESFSLFIRGPGGLVSKKNAKKSRNTATLNYSFS